MSRRLRHTWLLVVSALVLTSGVGCRLFSDQASVWKNPRWDEIRSATGQPLRVDLWKSNPHWSPLNELPEVVVADSSAELTRWTHPRLGAALDAAEQEGAIPTARRREIESVLRTRRHGPSDDDVNAWFAAVASSDDITGWNASILWAQYDPTAAQKTGRVLARLVLSPPKYQPDEAPRGRIDPSAAPQTSKDKGIEKTAASGVAQRALPIEISPNMRAAAAEAWCLVLAASHADAETALAPAGRALENEKLPTRIRDELMRGIARWVRPDHIPGLGAAFADEKRDSPRSLEARSAAGEACVIHAVERRLRGAVPSADSVLEPTSGDDAEALAAALTGDSPWPSAFWRLRHDPDPRLRMRVGELVAVIRHPGALAVLKAQLNDVDIHVRENALVNLGVLGTAAARAELAVLAKRAEERPRELAVRALACQGPAAVAAFTGDNSAVVRLEVARSMSKSPGGAASRVVRELLIDRSLDVQIACIQSIRDWPESLATPLLLDALAGSAFKTRQTALRQLEERRGGGLAFPLFAGPQERALRVQEWGRQWNIPDAAVERVNELTQQDSPRLDEFRLADLRDRLQSAGPPGSPEAVARIAEWTGELTPADVPLVERLLDEADPSQSDVILHHVLPRLSPAYGGLVQLENSEPAIRRRGAAEIARIGQATSLSPAVCRRLSELMKTEQDNLVWRFVMLGTGRDGSDEAGRLALLAINNPWPDVRILGCEYVGRHGQSEQASWLLPLFYDANRAVQLAAITAAGRCRNPLVLDGLRPADGRAPLRGLRPLLAETQGPLQFAVISSMSRLGDMQAMQELVRMALDINSTSRLEVVQTMGETGQTRFVEPLIRLAWTESNHHVREAALASLKRLVPPADQPKTLSAARNVAEAVEIWAAWWEDRRSPHEVGSR